MALVQGLGDRVSVVVVNLGMNRRESERHPARKLRAITDAKQQSLVLHWSYYRRPSSYSEWSCESLADRPTMGLTRIDIRVSDEVRQRIRALVHAWPGNPTESYVVRYLLEEGLNEVERQSHAPEQPPKGGR